MYLFIFNKTYTLGVWKSNWFGQWKPSLDLIKNIMLTLGYWQQSSCTMYKMVYQVHLMKKKIRVQLIIFSFNHLACHVSRYLLDWLKRPSTSAYIYMYACIKIFQWDKHSCISFKSVLFLNRVIIINQILHQHGQ